MKLTTIGILIILLSGLSFAQPDYAPKGDVRPTTIDDFYRHPSVGDEFNEAWQYNFTFTDGTKLFLNYTYMNVPFKGTKCGTNISFYNFNGKQYQIGREYPKERFKQDTDAKIISIKNASGPDNVFVMSGKPGDGHRVQFKTSKGNGYEVDLTFSETFPGKVKGDGVFDLHHTKIGLFVHIPYAKVSGTIRVGKTKKQVTGYAYMEQIWQSSMSTQIASHAIQVYGPESPLLGSVMIGSKKLHSKPYGYFINRTDSAIVFPKQVSSRGKVVEYDHKALNNPSFSLYDHPKTFSITKNKDQQKYSVLETIDGWFAKKAAKMAMGGEVVFFRGYGFLNTIPVDYNAYYLED